MKWVFNIRIIILLVIIIIVLNWIINRIFLTKKKKKDQKLFALKGSWWVCFWIYYLYVHIVYRKSPEFINYNMSGTFTQEMKSAAKQQTLNSQSMLMSRLTWSLDSKCNPRLTKMPKMNVRQCAAFPLICPLTQQSGIFNSTCKLESHMPSMRIATTFQIYVRLDYFILNSNFVLWIYFLSIIYIRWSSNSSADSFHGWRWNPIVLWDSCHCYLWDWSREIEGATENWTITIENAPESWHTRDQWDLFDHHKMLGNSQFQQVISW